MKKIWIVGMLIVSFLAACTGEKTLEQRFVYEDDKIVDVETGDEYILEDVEEFTVVHSDGTVEKIPLDEAPFYTGAFSAEYLDELDKNLEERKLRLIEEKKMKIKEARNARYAELSNDELLAKFKEGHSDGLELGIQMDMIAELIDRGVIAEDEAPVMLEIEPELIDFDINPEAPIM
ncbi:hypothetical protein [Mongoliitalea daihaiensis]|uniref:hypothetical protein n=1 Tax=Mongoliitalea daihaiensis TaxID=2782006 RepID=UPI001F2A80CC|nr:hypothetical protein [Mongoliitalea daihaiensis]UJP64858.1 hypothetical protein IPZ59_19035 [Mongoliitalea daihaiensis]